jgi:hypothetical protein
MKDEVSFLPDDYFERKIHRRTMWTAAAVVAIVAVAMALCLLHGRNNLRDAERSHANILRHYQDAGARFKRLCLQNEDQRKLIQHAALTTALIERVPRSNVLAELINRMPGGASLVDVVLESHARQEAAAPLLTAFDMKKAALEGRRNMDVVGIPQNPATEVGVKICGLAETDVEVAHYLSELSHSPLFRDVGLQISEAYILPGPTGRRLRRFQIQMTVNDSARLAPRPVDDDSVTADIDD